MTRYIPLRKDEHESSAHAFSMRTLRKILNLTYVLILPKSADSNRFPATRYYTWWQNRMKWLSRRFRFLNRAWLIWKHVIMADKKFH